MPMLMPIPKDNYLLYWNLRGFVVYKDYNTDATVDADTEM